MNDSRFSTTPRLGPPGSYSPWTGPLNPCPVLTGALLGLLLLSATQSPAETLRDATSSPTLAAPHDAMSTTQTLDSCAPAYPFFKDADRYPWVSMDNGARYQELHVGNGRTPAPGHAIYMHYRGHLGDGTVFDDTYKRRQWYRFTYGTNAILPALEKAMATMHEGGKRRILLPPALAYGEQGFNPDDTTENAVPIPPNSTLIFDITFLWMREPEYDKIRRFK